MLNSFANESISFDAKANQTPYRYSADAKEIIRNVHNFCKQKEEGLKISLNQAKERTSTVTGVSKSTIEQLMKRDRTKEEKSELPRKKRVQLDEFDLGVLRRTFNAMYLEGRILPTLSYIQTAMQEDIGYTGSKSILRKYMRQLGFTYKKSQTNRKLLMERGDVVLSRIRYLRKIRQLREAGCTIVYRDETYVHSNHTVSKTWQDGDIGASVPFSKGKNTAFRVFFYLHFVLQCRSLHVPEKDKVCDFKIKLLVFFR